MARLPRQGCPQGSCMLVVSNVHRDFASSGVSPQLRDQLVSATRGWRTSNLPFSGWGGVFGDQAVAAAMIDRIVHHADLLTLKGASATACAGAASTACPASAPPPTKPGP